MMISMSVPAAIPLVTGRHRNRALATARHARAVQLATEGRTYQEIADELGYANRGTVHHIVHDALARHRKVAVEDHQQLELERLDALQAALWDKAMAGDVEAAREVRAVIMARRAPRTVVLSAEDREVLGL
jgi:DNA-binding CsgD family transcriptional regulator